MDLWTTQHFSVLGFGITNWTQGWCILVKVAASVWMMTKTVPWAMGIGLKCTVKDVFLYFFFFFLFPFHQFLLLLFYVNIHPIFFYSLVSLFFFFDDLQSMYWLSYPAFYSSMNFSFVNGITTTHSQVCHNMPAPQNPSTIFPWMLDVVPHGLFDFGKQTFTLHSPSFLFLFYQLALPWNFVNVRFQWVSLSTCVDISSNCH